MVVGAVASVVRVLLVDRHAVRLAVRHVDRLHVSELQPGNLEPLLARRILVIGAVAVRVFALVR